MIDIDFELPHIVTDYELKNTLQENGIIWLTGESDNSGLSRILCDLTTNGLNIIKEFFSLKIMDGNNWNGSTNGEPHVASILLQPLIMPEIVKYILLRQGYAIIDCSEYQSGQRRILRFNNNEHMNAAYSLPEEERQWLIGTNIRMYYAQEKMRNQHMMSGRIS